MILWFKKLSIRSFCRYVWFFYKFYVIDSKFYWFWVTLSNFYVLYALMSKQEKLHSKHEWKLCLNGAWRIWFFLINVFWHSLCIFHRNVNLFFWYYQQLGSIICPLVPSYTFYNLIKGSMWPILVTYLQMELLNFGTLLTTNSDLKSKTWKCGAFSVSLPPCPPFQDTQSKYTPHTPPG